MVEGISINVDKLKQKLQERYPNHNFDIPPEPDTTHKSPSCLNNNQFYTDNNGDMFCGARYKQVEEGNIYKWEWKVCHALVKKADQGGNQDVIPF